MSGPRWRPVADQAGQDLIEYGVLTGLFALVCIILIPVLIKWPTLIDNALLLAVMGGLIGGIAWSAKQSISALTNRTQLGILEVLSSRGPLTRAELGAEIKQLDWPLRWLPEMYTDALTALVTAGKVTIVDGGRYAVAKTSSVAATGMSTTN